MDKAIPASRALKLLGLRLCLLPAACCLSTLAAEIDESKLPPSAAVKIDFTRDIKPILENSCIRCHGPEKPRSKYRLDNRESALKGGENGVDILPGNSAKSPLIHYVARLVKDLEMPPPDKGKPLGDDQIALLRAWIDQGVPWETNQPPPALAFSVSPIFGGTTVSGDERKFREHYWQREGVNGGLGQFELQEVAGEDAKFSATGHVLRDDYKLELDYRKNDFGFVHAGWEQYRKYYDDTGGYYPLFSPSAFSLGRDLHLDAGKAWIDFGLTLPDWPRMVLGYEYDYRKGEEGTLQWNTVTQGSLQRNIGPASRELNEGTHIIKFDLDHEIQGVLIEERFRGEFYNLNTHLTNAAYSGVYGTVLTGDARESYRQFEGANTIRLEKKFSDWLLGSAGYLYSKLNADSTFSLDTLSAFVEQHWRSPRITLERESHVFNVNSLLGPFDGLTISSGVQSEWTRERGFGSADLDSVFVGPPPFPFLNPAVLNSDYDKASVEENLALRYTKIPSTSLFAEARLQQQSIGQFEELLETNPSARDDEDFLQHTAFSSQLTDFRAGFATSPWRSVSFSAHYRRYDDDSRYHHNRDEQPHGAMPGPGYPAFINAIDLLTDEVETKLVLRPCNWLKTSLSYRLLTTHYRTDTDPYSQIFPPAVITPGGPVSSRDDSHIYSINGTFTPLQRLYFSVTLSYQDSSAITEYNGAPSVAPYRGDIYTVLANGTCVLSRSTDLFVNYSFSDADYAQNNFAGGLPVGLEYQQHGVQIGIARRFGKNLTTKLQYGYYSYHEPSGGGVNNYTAHSIFATLTYRLP